LRNYLDQPVFVRALGGGDREFPNSICHAIFQSTFEALLDEHIWLIKQINGLRDAEIAKELLSGLTIRSSNAFVHSLTNLSDKFTLRCHVALPFTETQARDIAGQTDERLTCPPKNSPAEM
jgi:hypothetical protein